MEVKFQTSTSPELVKKKEVSVRSVLNIIGVCIFLGIMLTVVTNPYSIAGNFDFHQNKEIIMNPKKLKEFLLFISGAAFLYFFMVNVYYIGGLWRKLFFIILIVIVLSSIYMVFRLYQLKYLL